MSPVDVTGPAKKYRTPAAGGSRLVAPPLALGLLHVASLRSQPPAVGSPFGRLFPPPKGRSGRLCSLAATLALPLDDWLLQFCSSRPGYFNSACSIRVAIQ